MTDINEAGAFELAHQLREVLPPTASPRLRSELGRFIGEQARDLMALCVLVGQLTPKDLGRARACAGQLAVMFPDTVLAAPLAQALDELAIQDRPAAGKPTSRARR